MGLEIDNEPAKKRKSKKTRRKGRLLAKNKSIYPFIVLYHLYTKKIKAAVSSAVAAMVVVAAVAAYYNYADPTTEISQAISWVIQ